MHGTEADVQSSCDLRDGQFTGSCVGVGRWNAVDVANPANRGHVEGLPTTCSQASVGKLSNDLMIGVTSHPLDEVDGRDRVATAERRRARDDDLFGGSRPPMDADVHWAADPARLGRQRHVGDECSQKSLPIFVR